MSKSKTVKRTPIFHALIKDSVKWVSGYYVHLVDTYKKRESHRIYTGFAESEIDNDGYEFYPSWYEIDPKSLWWEEE